MFALIVYLALLWTAASGQTKNPDVDREIIVQYKPNVLKLPAGRTESSVDELASIDAVDVFVLRLSQTNARSALLTKLNKLPTVVYAEPNIRVVNRGTLQPTDPSFALQWNMDNSDETDIDAQRAWGIHTGSANDIIGIVDDGNIMTPSNPHSEFSGRVIYGDATPVINLDQSGLSHAALVAGIAAAKGNGGNLSSTEGIAGMNWNATIYSKDRGSDATAADAVRAAVDAGAQVINNSWGQEVDAFSITIARAFAYAYKSNRLSSSWRMGSEL